MSATNGNPAVEQLTKCCPLKSVLQGSVAVESAEASHLLSLTFLFFCFVFRFDEAALSIQKEKNIYKEIENYPTCYKVFFEYVWLDFTLDILHIGIRYSS